MHILTPSVNLTFRPKSVFKNKCRARAGHGLVNSDSGRAQASKWGPFTILCVYVCKGHQREIERIRPPPTNSKNRLKSFCEVGYVSVFQRFCCSGTFSKCLRCSCDPMQPWHIGALLQPRRTVVTNFFPGQFGLFRGNPPGSHSRHPVVPRNPGWKTLGYANFRPNVFAAGKRISMKIWVEVRLHAWFPVALKIFVAFSKKWKCAR